MMNDISDVKTYPKNVDDIRSREYPALKGKTISRREEAQADGHARQHLS